MRCLVYLSWPEKCFRALPADIDFLKTLLPRGAEVVAVKSDAAFLRELPSATHVITWHFRKEWYAKAAKLKVVATPGAGRELVSQDAPKGVKIHFGGFHGAIMSETVVAFILAYAHGFFAARAYAGYGGAKPSKIPNWPRAELSDSCFTIAETRAAIVGYGRIGHTIGEKLAALGVHVTGYRRANIADLDAELPNVDWLVLALPSDTGTDNFLSKARLAKLPRRAVVVNVGRGNAIDEAALLSALRSRRLAAAYLDVFKGEPGPLTTGSVPNASRTRVPDAARVPLVASTSLAAKPLGRRERRKGREGREGCSILGTGPIALPPNLIRMPHSSAFSRDYMKRCFTELKNDGCL